MILIFWNLSYHIDILISISKIKNSQLKHLLFKTFLSLNFEILVFRGKESLVFNKAHPISKTMKFSYCKIDDKCSLKINDKFSLALLMINFCWKILYHIIDDIFQLENYHIVASMIIRCSKIIISYRWWTAEEEKKKILVLHFQTSPICEAAKKQKNKR